MTNQAKNPRITQRDVARLAEVSVATVSLALRNSPRISEDKKAKIARICEEVGYVRDGRLSELMSHLRKSHAAEGQATLAAVITHPDSGDRNVAAGQAELLKALRERAGEEGYALDVFDLGKEALNVRRLKQILVARGIRGMVVLPSDDHGLIEGMDFSGLSVVGIGYEMENPAPHRVCPNYLKMGDELMRDLSNNGYRRIGFVPEQSERLLKNRMLNTSIHYHLSERPDAVRVPRYEGSLDDVAALNDWLAQHRPDVVIGNRKALERFEEMDLAVPRDFGFACWDVCGLPEQVSGMDLRYDLMGWEAVRLTVANLHANFVGVPEHPEILVVDSCYRSAASTERLVELAPLRSAV